MNQRQQHILDYIYEHNSATNAELLDLLSKETPVTRVTIARDLTQLVELGLLKKAGGGRSVSYEANSLNPLLRPFHHQSYFDIDVDNREMRASFDFTIFDQVYAWDQVFTDQELAYLTQLNTAYQSHRDLMSTQLFQKELERVTIEFSWKSSHIEGNTYSLLDTEQLLKNNQEAAGHDHKEAQMIINHKDALDYIYQDPAYFKVLSVHKINEIHALLVKDLNIPEGIRKRIVGITGTRYQPLDNAFQIQEALEKAIVIINGLNSVYSRILATLLLLSYLQPFEDGNKRTSRVIGNAILMAYSMCPLSYRSVDEGLYKKAMLLFYEQHSATLFKKLFLEQVAFAIENYFL